MQTRDLERGESTRVLGSLATIATLNRDTRPAPFTMQIRDLERSPLNFRALGSLVSDRTGPAFTMRIRELERHGEFSSRALGSLVSDRTGPAFTMQIREVERQPAFTMQTRRELERQ